MLWVVSDGWWWMGEWMGEWWVMSDDEWWWVMMGGCGWWVDVDDGWMWMMGEWWVSDGWVMDRGMMWLVSWDTNTDIKTCYLSSKSHYAENRFRVLEDSAPFVSRNPKSAQFRWTTRSWCRGLVWWHHCQGNNMTMTMIWQWDIITCDAPSFSYYRVCCLCECVVSDAYLSWERKKNLFPKLSKTYDPFPGGVLIPGIATLKIWSTC